MARPERKTVDYFPFYVEEGQKMFYIEETYGNDGFAVFVKILRELAKVENHYLDLSKPTQLMFLSAKCKVSKEVLEAIIKDLVNLEKFDDELWDECKIVWCQDFIDSIQDAYRKRNNLCMTKQGLSSILISLGRKKLDKGIVKGVSNTQIKEKEIKVNNTIPSIDEFVAYSLSLKPNINIENVKLKFNSWLVNDWKINRNGKDVLIKNWKTTLSNTIQYLGEKEINVDPYKISV